MRCILFAIATMWVFADAQPVMSANATEKVIAAAAPYIEAALTQPMAGLYALADTDEIDAEDALRFGLALYAGRQPAVTVDIQDAETLRTMEARVAPLANAQLERDPGAKLSRDKWRKIVGATDEEMAVIDRFQKRHMADYWLRIARDSNSRYLVQRGVTYSQTGEGNRSPLSGRSIGRSSKSSVDLFAARREIPLDVFFSTNNCVFAVRRAANLRHFRPRDMLVSVQILWDFAPYDAESGVEGVLEEGLSRSLRHVPLTNAACGTDEQFDSYVAMLKAAQGL